MGREQASMVLSQGAMYTITLVAGAAVYGVVPRPDMSREETAEAATASLAAVQAACDHLGVKGMIVDQRKMAGVPGPKTEQMIAAALAMFERKPKPVALLIASQPVLRMQMSRLVAAHAPTQGRVLTSLAQAHLWVAGVDPAGSP